MWCLIIYHSSFRLSSELLKIFEIFINLRFSVIRHCCECRNLIYHKNLLCQARFLIFSSFLSACPALHELVMRRRTRHNISPEFILSNHFEQKICFFLQKSCPTRKRVGAGVYAGNVMATVVCRLRGCGAGDRCAGGWRGQYGNGGVQAAGA